ncbi:hypothetical protein E3N88_14299 [Mikania micrantha]|uniref:Aminotransferase-like plant mobile domain-containing protein n=1 Tax=Mikania micrantha TaxID=192012 RepID=A0A5N6P138_9ASTR|nr:hypothetical protein E3N88_14299 [Mikania micrantha]
MNLGVNPGPLNEDVLFLPDTHRARALFTNTIPDNVQLNVRRGDQKFWEYIRDHHVPEPVMTYIRLAGFGGIIDCGYRTVDHALITALVERWRPETHTFHLPFGEVTVTLQDVQVLWGLSVNGQVVSGIDYVCPIEQNVAKCAELNLCKGTSYLAKEISGPMFLLQMWAWERITCMSPILYFDFDSTKPYGARWRSNLSYSQTIAHVVKGFRSQLTELHESMFKWTPYDHVLSLLPPICTSDANCWRCETYIIYWEIVEYHAPSRVTRQFNILQKIPNALPIDKAEHKRLHALTRQGKANKDWRREHHHYMQAWDGRFFNVVNGEFNNVAGVSIDYMQWFWERTVLYITNPGHHEANPHGYQNHGGRFQVMVDGVTQMYQMTGNLIGTYPENAQQLEPLRDMAIDFMGIVNQRSRLNYSTTHLTRNNVEFGDDIVPQRARRRTRTRARRQGDERGMEQNFHQEFYTPFDSQIPSVSQDFTQENYFAPNQEDSNMPNFEAGSPIPFNLNNRPSRDARRPPCGT